jgi:pyruvate,water dikinase
LLDGELLNSWTTPIINDFYVMMTNGKVNRRLKNIGIHNVEEFLSRYLSGDQQIESAQPAIALQKLAEEAKANEEIKKSIIELGDDVHDKIQNAFVDFHQQVTGFINLYGDRTVGELKLETVTMRIAPIVFYKYLRNFLIANTTLAGGNSNSRQAAIKELEEKLSNKPGYVKRQVNRTLAKLQNAIRYREALRLERTRLFGMYRSLYVAVGNYFYIHNILNTARDIFYLTEKEITETDLNKAVDLKALVEERKKEFETYKKEDVPARVVIPSPPSTVTHNTDDPAKLVGTGCYPGKVTGNAIVVLGPESDLDVSGKIVCALRTDPGWASLFPTCLGVLIEKGSALSHSVILLREFGIPTIINLPGLTRRLSSGQRITMDGLTGEVQIAEDETD